MEFDWVRSIISLGSYKNGYNYPLWTGYRKYKESLRKKLDNSQSKQYHYLNRIRILSPRALNQSYDSNFNLEAKMVRLWAAFFRLFFYFNYRWRLTMSQERKNKTITPKFRFSLKAQIIGTGYKTITDFSRKTGIDMPRLSQIIRGWQTPGPHLQRTMAECLGITLSELRELF